MLRKENTCAGAATLISFRLSHSGNQAKTAAKAWSGHGSGKADRPETCIRGATGILGAAPPVSQRAYSEAVADSAPAATSERTAESRLPREPGKSDPRPGKPAKEVRDAEPARSQSRCGSRRA